jgi:hypothetical protein
LFQDESFERSIQKLAARSTCLAAAHHLSAMNRVFWALLSAFFAGLTAVLARIGVAGVDSNLATAIRTTGVLAFTWGSL